MTSCVFAARTLARIVCGLLLLAPARGIGAQSGFTLATAVRAIDRSSRLDSLLSAIDVNWAQSCKRWVTLFGDEHDVPVCREWVTTNPALQQLPPDRRGDLGQVNEIHATSERAMRFLLESLPSGADAAVRTRLLGSWTKGQLLAALFVQHVRRNVARDVWSFDVAADTLMSRIKALRSTPPRSAFAGDDDAKRGEITGLCTFAWDAIERATLPVQDKHMPTGSLQCWP
ncbi:MAG: hypothetical protein IPK85_05625 [Gemmatimonadetes bacterium]|nr:hypothetical protein [Gemmatimonadota bacterium]